jgi:dihydroflavonol-4-reductase
MSENVFLTGAGGFVGWHVLRELLAAGYQVRALSRTSTLAHPDFLPAMPGMDQLRIVRGDMENVGAFARALDGCRFVIHCAALYSFTPSDRVVMHRVNVVGTASLLEAARVAGVERVIVTSSSATLGPCSNGKPRTENDWATQGQASTYHHSKIEQERAALAARVPVVAMLPTAPVGPGDWKPTPTGRMILDFARGKIFAKPPRGGLNLVAVEDVARAHVAAIERGIPGERYIIGGENMLLDDVWHVLAEVTGRAVPSWRVPYALAIAIAHVDEARCQVNRAARPTVPLEGVRMSRERMFVDSSKAVQQLNFHAGPIRDALERAVQWYRQHGYVS